MDFRMCTRFLQIVTQNKIFMNSMYRKPFFEQSIILKTPAIKQNNLFLPFVAVGC